MAAPTSDEPDEAEILRVLTTAAAIRVTEDGCWLYAGRKQIKRPDSNRLATAHRWFWEVFREEEPPEVLVPLCENGLKRVGGRLLPVLPCVNPDHYRGQSWREHSTEQWQRFRETRTHCRHGHELAKVGTDERGVCLACIKETQQRSYQRRKKRRQQQGRA